jgi:hypothetical protein
MYRLLTKLYFQLTGEKLMYLSYTTDWPWSSVGHPAGALVKICLWVSLTLLTYALWDALSKDIAPGEF